MCLYPYQKETARMTEKTKLWEYPLLFLGGIVLLPVLIGTIIRRIFY